MKDNDLFSDPIDPRVARRRIMAQGMNILHSLAEMYNVGGLEDPRQCASLCTMFSLIAEGKVTGHFDEDSGLTKWSLTDNYIKRLREAEESILASKIIKGPWKNVLDKSPNS